ncbi:hypothetical protein SIID45300_01751 [Candidatus Magnetaquicoccaceae bacterium FCR-1]|uniref:Peptidase n=1 Tax=Candidatus Magnetaquiglobus chichijimensis TaxID=3141448 RepID=A0ABQ0C953_9PROT
MPDSTRKIRIFRAGRHTDGAGVTREFSTSDLDTIVSGYSAKDHQAPLVIGHPATDAPAYGWVQKLSRTGDELYAHLEQLSSDVIEMVQNGHFKHVSAAFYPPGSPGNPQTSGFALRHVGLLGAQPPAVKGLGAVKFGDGDDAVVIESRGDAVIAFHESQPQKKENQPMPDQDQTAAFAEMDKRQKDLAAREADLAAREKKMQDDERDRLRRAHVEFAEAQAKEGRILPRDKSGIVATLTALDSLAAVEFAEGDATIKKSPVEILKGFIAELPARVDFSERSAPDKTPPATGSYRAPSGFSVDLARAALHQRATAYAAAHNTDYLTAVLVMEGSR